MQIIRRDWFDVRRPDTFSLIPIGDVHIGSAACDENRFQAVVDSIAQRENCYWVGLGDYAEFINVRDPRFNIASLAEWVEVKDLTDLARVQRDRFLKVVEPIADKCLALVEGNHERAIRRHSERDVYSEIVSGVKQAAGWPESRRLGVGYYGWLLLNFYRHKKKRTNGTQLKLNLHHGYVGGRLAGAKALNMQRWLWSHDADLVLMGHSHNTMAQAESVERVDQRGNVVHVKRIGVYAGTFMRSTAGGVESYAEEKGYLPLPVGHVEIILRPCSHKRMERIRVVT